MADKVSNQTLLQTALVMMKAAGKPLEKIQTKTRAMKYRLKNGETVRVRTCNDHVLVVLADIAGESEVLNIEGTNHLLIVMPEVPRKEGFVIAYFLPTALAVEAIWSVYTRWGASAPSTKGTNRTCNIWFEEGAAKSEGFALKWSQYRVPGQLSTLVVKPAADATADRDNRPLGVVIAEARRKIAEAAGVSVDAVKISVVLD